MAEEGGRVHHFQIGAQARAEMLAAHSAGMMHGEMHEHAQKSAVNLADPAELKAHLMSAHDWDHSDFHRNSQPDEVDRVLGPSHDDYTMSHAQLRKVHDHHDHVEYRHDFPSSTTLGDSHFHEA